MSVHIDVGPYRIESYAEGWTMGEPRTRMRKDRETGEESPETRLVRQTYHGSLTQVLRALQDRWLRDSSADSFEELLAELKAFRAEVAGLFEITVREPDRDRHRNS